MFFVCSHFSDCQRMAFVEENFELERPSALLGSLTVRHGYLAKGPVGQEENSSYLQRGTRRMR